MRWLFVATLLAGCQGQGELLPSFARPTAEKPVEFIVTIWTFRF
jgi:hypothetical protein